MTHRDPTTPAGGARSLIVPLVLTNIGVLAVFLWGPNAAHPLLPVAYAGAAAAIVSAAMLVRRLVARRSSTGSPTGPRR